MKTCVTCKWLYLARWPGDKNSCGRGKIDLHWKDINKFWCTEHKDREDEMKYQMTQADEDLLVREINQYEYEDGPRETVPRGRKSKAKTAQ